MTGTTQHYAVFETAAGACAIAWSGVSVTCFRLPSTTADATERSLLRRMPRATPAAPPMQIADVVTAVRQYFEGERIDFSLVALDLGTQDPFFARIYEALRKVEWGKTTTYGTLAKELGAGPEAARDVGQAMAKNPVPLIIPCHRVLAAGGKIGGFSAPGGSTAKTRLLELEGISVQPPRPAQQSFAF